MKASNEEVDAEVVRMFRDDGETPVRITRRLRARGIAISVNVVQEILRDADLPDTPELRGDRKRRGGPERTEIPNLDEYGQRWMSGKWTIETLAKDAGVTSSVLYARLKEAHYLAPRKRADIPNLVELAERWAEGAGELLADLAEEAGVSSPTLRARFAEAGYVRKYRRALTPEEWGKIAAKRAAQRAAKAATKKKPAAGAATRRRVPRGGYRPRAPRVTTPKIDNLEALADRFLNNGETLGALAGEIGVHQSTLSAELKKFGHIPNVNLTRVRGIRGVGRGE